MKPVVLFLLACLFALPMSAQEGVPFNGLITDVNGKGISNVKVSLLKAAEKRTRTNRKGRFGLTDVLADDTLKLVWKKETYTIPIAGRKSLKIVWQSQSCALQANEDKDLVDFGYGFVKRREFTGYSSGISGDELRKSGATTILGALQGRIAGLNITTSSAPGGEDKVMIHGQKSFYASSTPLFVVDGVVVSDISSISIYDVDYVEVMKDGSIYGSQGANGAILIRTKRGGK